MIWYAALYLIGYLFRAIQFWRKRSSLCHYLLKWDPVISSKKRSRQYILVTSVNNGVPRGGHLEQRRPGGGTSTAAFASGSFGPRRLSFRSLESPAGLERGTAICEDRAWRRESAVKTRYSRSDNPLKHKRKRSRELIRDKACAQCPPQNTSGGEPVIY